MSFDSPTVALQQNENQEEDKKSKLQHLIDEKQRLIGLEQEQMMTANEAEQDQLLRSLGATEEESLVPPDIDSKDLEAYAKHEGSFTPSSELTADEAREIEKFMVDLKEKIESKDAESLQLLMTSETYPVRDAIKTIYAKMFGESMEKAMQKNGLYPDNLKNSLSEKKERVFAIKQKVLDACFGLAA